MKNYNEIAKKTIVVVHVNEKYDDIAVIFFELFERFWSDCPYSVVVSCKGKLVNDFGKDMYEADKNTSLPEDICIIMELYRADYCISFLGDAFITKMIKNNNVEMIINKMEKENISYCRLFNSLDTAKSFSPIPKDELYGVSFIAFISSYEFAAKEFHNKTDFEFEIKYLNTAKEMKSRNTSWTTLCAIPNSEFNIVHGIVKGLWIPKSYRIISSILEDKLCSKHRQMRFVENLQYHFRLGMRKYRISSIIMRKK